MVVEGAKQLRSQQAPTAPQGAGVVVEGAQRIRSQPELRGAGVVVEGTQRLRSHQAS